MMEMSTLRETNTPEEEAATGGFRGKWRRLVLSVILGQLLSIFICGTAVSSEFLQKSGISTPVAQSLFNYLLLGFVFGTICVYRLAVNGRFWTTLRTRGGLYIMAAFIDVEANYAIVKAYQYTSVTSVQLLDCLSIPSVLILSLLLFGIRYRLNHYFGVFLCLLGVAGMLVADHFTKGSSFEGSNRILGDFLVIIGAICYGISNVFQEYLVRNYSKLDYMGLLGIFASLISGLQFLIMESGETRYLIAKASINPLIWMWYAVFGLSMFALYSIMPTVMERSSAVIVNLNLLTADVYALIVGLFVFSYKFNWLYFVAYAAIMLGVFLYVLKEPRSERIEGGGVLSRFLSKFCRCDTEGNSEILPPET